MKTSGLIPLNSSQMRSPGDSAYWAFFSHDGKRIFSGGSGSKIWIWDVEHFELDGYIETDLDGLYGADLHPTSERLAAGNPDRSIRVWDLSTGKETVCIQRHRKYISDVRFYDEGRLLASASGDRTVRMSDASTGKRVGRLKRVGPRINRVAAASDGSCFGATYYYGVQVWNRELKNVFHLEGLYYHGGRLQSDIALPRNGQQLWVSFRTTPELCVWDLKHDNQEPLHMVKLKELFSKDIYDYRQEYVQRPLHTFELGQPAFRLAFSNDDRFMAVALWDEIVLIKTDSCEVLHRWKVPLGNEPQRTGGVGHLSFSPDGRLLSAVSVSTYRGAGGIWLWSI